MRMLRYLEELISARFLSNFSQLRLAEQTGVITNKERSYLNHLRRSYAEFEELSNRYTEITASLPKRTNAGLKVAEIISQAQNRERGVAFVIAIAFAVCRNNWPVTHSGASQLLERFKEDPDVSLLISYIHHCNRLDAFTLMKESVFQLLLVRLGLRERNHIRILERWHLTITLAFDFLDESNRKALPRHSSHYNELLGVAEELSEYTKDLEFPECLEDINYSGERENLRKLKKRCWNQRFMFLLWLILSILVMVVKFLGFGSLNYF